MAISIHYFFFISLYLSVDIHQFLVICSEISSLYQYLPLFLYLHCFLFHFPDRFLFFIRHCSYSFSIPFSHSISSHFLYLSLHSLPFHVSVSAPSALLPNEGKRAGRFNSRQPRQYNSRKAEAVTQATGTRQPPFVRLSHRARLSHDFWRRGGS